MASRFEQPDILACRQCENCGATEGLLRCSRCHAAWFCSLRCHRAYWPMHKPACCRNDFADAVEAAEPKFAAWMRGHGKLAVLQDEEVERLERSSRPGGWCGLGRQEVLTGMYGRMDPSPAAPSYTIPGNVGGQPAGTDTGLTAGGSASERAWQQLRVPESLGLAGTRVKWWQNLAAVGVYVRLPDSVTPKQVSVQLGPRSLSVSVAGDVLVAGQLAADIKVEGSTWFCDDGMVQLQLLKRNRKGSYADGCTAADTFWFSLLAGANGCDRLQLAHPPTAYYSTACEPWAAGA